MALALHKNPQTDKLLFPDKQTIAELVAAMTLVESGTSYYPIEDYKEFIISVYEKNF